MNEKALKSLVMLPSSCRTLDFRDPVTAPWVGLPALHEATRVISWGATDDGSEAHTWCKHGERLLEIIVPALGHVQYSRARYMVEDLKRSFASRAFAKDLRRALRG